MLLRQDYNITEKIGLDTAGIILVGTSSLSPDHPYKEIINYLTQNQFYERSYHPMNSLSYYFFTRQFQRSVLVSYLQFCEEDPSSNQAEVQECANIFKSFLNNSETKGFTPSSTTYPASNNSKIQIIILSKRPPLNVQEYGQKLQEMLKYKSEINYL